MPSPDTASGRVRLVGWAVFAGCLAVYLATACRSVYWFDSPEFTTTAVNLDISHPPGYPLWNFAAHLFTWLPVGTQAFRVAAFSSVCAAAAAAMFFRLLVATGLGLPAALGASLMLAFCRQVWSLAVIAEVYAMELALLTGLLWSLMPGPGGRPMPRPALSALLAGSLVAHRPADVLFLPFLLALAVPARTELPRAAGWFAAAWLPHLYTWWHLRNRFSMNYFDYPADLTTYLGIVTGRLYAGSLFAASARDALVDFKNYLGLISDQFGPLLLLAVAGLAIAVRARRGELLAIVGIFAANVVFAVNYNAVEADTMVLPSLAMLCWLAGMGLQAAVESAATAGGEGRLSTLARMVAIAAPLTLVALNWPACDRSRFDEVDRYLAEVSALAPRGAHLLAFNDVDSMALLYGRFCLQRRTDLGLTLVTRWDEGVAGTVRAQLARGARVLGSMQLPAAELDEARHAFRLRRQGFLFRLEDAHSGADGPCVAGGEAFGEGVSLLSLEAPSRLPVWPGLAALEARWNLAARRAVRRPGVVLALAESSGGPDAGPIWSCILPVSGLEVAPGAGEWRDRYPFRLGPDVRPGRYRLLAGVVDLATLSGAAGPTGASGAGGAIESFDPATMPVADHWREQFARTLACIRECVPYGVPSWRVTSWQALLAHLVPTTTGGRLLDRGPVLVEPPAGPALTVRP